jgi:hypothetical protein
MIEELQVCLRAQSLLNGLRINIVLTYSKCIVLLLSIDGSFDSKHNIFTNEESIHATACST